jgi:hypothetical protein
MTTYILKNTRFVKRDHEATNVVACTYEGPIKPGIVDRLEWIPAGPSTLNGLTKLWTECGVTFYGYL